jgi:uncharacterized protein YcnI
MRFGSRAAVAAFAAAALTIAVAAPAFAHVTVDPASAPKGGEITLGFRVPNEEATASTVKIQIFFPSDHPILGVDPQSAPGWTDLIHTSALNPPVFTDDGPLTDYISEVDWYGGAIKPGHFQEFYVLAQQLPTTSQVVFKALQTYSDGNVVRWIQPVVAGQPEPDHPTPILQLTNGTPTASGSSGSSSDRTAIVAVVLGGIGVVLGGAALALVLRGRRQPGTTPVPGTPVAAAGAATPVADTPRPGPAPAVNEAITAERVPATAGAEVISPASKSSAGDAPPSTAPAEDRPTTP